VALLVLGHLRVGIPPAAFARRPEPPAARRAWQRADAWRQSGFGGALRCRRVARSSSATETRSGSLVASPSKKSAWPRWRHGAVRLGLPPWHSHHQAQRLGAASAPAIPAQMTSAARHRAWRMSGVTIWAARSDRSEAPRAKRGPVRQTGSFTRSVKKGRSAISGDGKGRTFNDLVHP
jgi:hypothetical protein